VAWSAIALNRKYYNRDKELVEEVAFINVKAFGKTAELLQEHFPKGSRLLLRGRLYQNKFEDKDGNKRSDVGVIAEAVFFTDSKAKGDEEEEAEERSFASPRRGRPRSDKEPNDEEESPRKKNVAKEDDDDVPF
jgi:single-strand DNA-binding protein